MIVSEKVKKKKKTLSLMADKNGLWTYRPSFLGSSFQIFCWGWHYYVAMHAR